MATSTSATAPASRRAGHTRSLLCCHSPLTTPSIVATSSQDGTVCLFDLRIKDNVQRLDCFGQEAVNSICFSPENSEIIYAAAGTAIYCMDVRLGPMGREIQKYSYNTEEINQVAVNQKASYLAAADDSGEIKVIDLHSHKLLKTLRGVHTNICSTVQFHAHRPWELTSGGLDAKLVKWDFSKGRPVKVIDQGIDAGCSASDRSNSTQFCNPPFVHVLSTLENKLSGAAGRAMALAKGDGRVEVCDDALERWQELRPDRINFRYLNEVKKGEAAENTAVVETFDDKVAGHMLAVSCITFARFSQGGSIVVSGSNDKSIKLWTWSQKDEKKASDGNLTHPTSGPLTLTINHNKKVNWLCTAASSSENLFVADTSKLLTIYTVL